MIQSNNRAGLFRRIIWPMLEKASTELRSLIDIVGDRPWVGPVRVERWWST
jgi:hypothetical protein